MSFKVVNQTIPHQGALESLIKPAPRDSNVIELDYSVTTQISFYDLFDAHVLNIKNVSGATPSMSLPSNDILLALFSSPQEKSLLAWTIETDGPSLDITSDDDIVNITTGIWVLYLQILDPDTPTFNLISHSIGGSIPLPSTYSYTVTTAGGTLSAVNLRQFSTITPVTASLNSGDPAPVGLENVLLDTPANYWLYVFSNKSYPVDGKALYYSLIIINNTDPPVALNLSSAVGTVSLTGSPVALLPGQAYTLSMVWTSATSATASVTDL